MTVIDGPGPAVAPNVERPRSTGRSAWRRALGLALVVFGLGLPLSVHSTVRSLADDLRTELAERVAASDFEVLDTGNGNLLFGTGPLGTAQLRHADDDVDQIRVLRSLLRDEGFQLGGADPETWWIERTDSYDGTTWSIELADDEQSELVKVRMGTTDDDGRILLPFALLVGLVMIAGGVALAKSPESV